MSLIAGAIKLMNDIFFYMGLRVMPGNFVCFGSGYEFIL